MKRIIPHLWFDKEAKEAAEFYVSTFGGDSNLTSVVTIHNTPSGTVDNVSFRILGQDFMAISAGPLFTVNPSISFHVKCATAKEIDALWEKLSPGGMALMELGSYPFSDRYGWIQDKYGLSWQLILPRGDDLSQRIMPALMFTGKLAGKAEEAVKFYVSVFPSSEVRTISRYGADTPPDKEGTVAYADFSLFGMQFGAMDSARRHEFTFNEAISLVVPCDTQEEIDMLWEKLSAVPEAEQCGWLKDKYGVSWQIVPAEMSEMMGGGDEKKIARVTEAFLKMKKFDIAKLREAAKGQ